MKLIIIIAITLLFSTVVPAQNWPAFRGANSSGTADGGSPPTVWDAEKSTNILWKTPIPGLGHSSPVVWGDRVFITTAVSSATASEFVHGLIDTGDSAKDTSKHSWRLYCLDKNTGRVIWEKIAYEGVPRVKRHVKSSYANSTPATDGKYVVVSFGSEGLFCFDFSGKLVWKRDLGVLDGGWSSGPDFHWGFGSSPVIYRKLVIVQCDTQAQSFIAAFDVGDGRRVWQTAREEDTSWSTPAIYEGNDHAELVTSGARFYRGYDPSTGKELWRLADGADVKIPTPVIAQGLYFLGGGAANGRRTFYALRSGLKGEIKVDPKTEAATAIAWQSPVI
jgi:outer membrane protein assembly factor BamB